MPALAFIKRHPVVTYFVLAFAISWGGVLLVIALGHGGLPTNAQQFAALSPVAIPVMVLGPSVSGLLLTAIVGGRAGLRDLLSRLLRWRVGARWYAVALLAAPLLMLTVLLALSLNSPVYLPSLLVVHDKASRVLFGFFAALTAGIFEELGWTGFAIPHLRRQYSVRATGLIVGILWAAWHLLVAYWATGTVSGSLALASYLLDPFLFLVGFRVLMVWVYDQTQSLLVAMLMHVSLTASTLILGAFSLAGVSLIMEDLVWAAAVWVIMAMVASGTAGRPRQQPAQSWAALAFLASGGFLMLSAIIFLSPFVMSPYAIENDVYMGNLFLGLPLFLLGGVFVLAGQLIARLQGRTVPWGPGLLLAGAGGVLLALLYVRVGGHYTSFGPPVSWPPYLNEAMMRITLTVGVVECIIGVGWGLLAQSHRRAHTPAGT